MEDLKIENPAHQFYHLNKFSYVPLNENNYGE